MSIQNEISQLVAFAKADTTNTYQDICFCVIPNFLAQAINAATGVSVRGTTMYLTASGIRHAFNSHGNHKMENTRGQVGIKDSDFELIPLILSNPDSYTRGNNNRKGNEAILFRKTINGKIYYVVMSKLTNERLVFNTMYIKK